MTTATQLRPSLAVNEGVLAALAELAASPAFASRDDVESMAARLQQRVGLHTGPGIAGQRYFLRLSPGTVGLRVATVNAMDVNDGSERSDAAVVAVGGETTRQGVDEDLALFDLEADPARRITSWSRRSRARMAERIAELDYSSWGGGSLGMVTLTLAGPWEAIAPDAVTFKNLIERMRLRTIKARDEDGRLLQWRGLWKLEFQRRGAPHLHTLMRIPARVNGERFETWLADTWAAVVLESLPLVSDVDLLGYAAALGYAEPATRRGYVAAGHYRKHQAKGTDVSFSGVKWSDPRRTAIYFSKHSSKTLDDKEYQHVVPALWLEDGKGPGRFWGYWALERAVYEVEVDRAAFNHARRVLRHVARSRQVVTQMSRLRAELGRGPEFTKALVAMRRPRRRGGFGAVGGGWVLVNDGVALAWDVGRSLRDC